MKEFKLIFILIIFNLLSSYNAYRILAVFPFNGKSHNIILESVTKSLAKRGHQVDVVTHWPQKKPVKNLNDIINLDGSMESIVNNYTIEFVSTITGDIVNLIAVSYGNRLCHFMGFEKFQKLIKNPPQDPPYDLVIVEAFGANCYFGLGHVFKVPVVAVSSAVEYPWVSHFIGNVDNLAIVPNAFQIGFGKMNFWSRLQNFYLNFIALQKFHKLTEQSQTDSMRKYLSPDIPNIREVEKSVALTLVNTHPILYGIKPITPALVQIAGLHIENNEEKLSTDLQKWMDESSQGVVYFSLGSLVLIETLPSHLLEELYDTFEKISPVRVLVKIFDESKLPQGLPKNVKTLPWIPQQPVLAHKNTRVFITHGGLGGVEEALYYGIPMIGIPLFSDQFRNVEAFIPKGMMLRIRFNELRGEKVYQALSTVLGNSDFKKNAVYYSELFRDRPMSATNSTIFWIEYVIRNGGNVLKSPALELSWWQLDLLDIYGFFLLIFIFVVSTIIFSFQKLVKLLTQKLSKRDENKKKK